MNVTDRMKSFFRPNIGRSGRLVRASLAAALLLGGIMAVQQIIWLGVVLFISSAFVLFEAARGWCLMRACGIKTKL